MKHGYRRIAGSGLAILALCLAGCADPPRANNFSQEVYECVLHYASSEYAFRLDFALTADRRDSRLRVKLVGEPVLKDTYPELPPGEGPFEGIKGRYSFKKLGRGGLLQDGYYDFSSLLPEPEAAAGKTLVDLAFQDQESLAAAAKGALALALAEGLGCRDLDAWSEGELDDNGGDKLVIQSQGYYVETRSESAEDGIASRSLVMKNRRFDENQALDWGDRWISVEIAAVDCAPEDRLSSPVPRRWPHQLLGQEGWRLPRIDGSTATIPLTAAIYSRLQAIPMAEAADLVRHNKTHEAFVNVVEGSCDLAFVTEPSPEELEFAASKGIELSIEPVAREAFVFLVNAVNPVESLSLQSIRDIYAGRVKLWSELGGHPKAAISAFTRPSNSGSQTLFEKLILPPDEIAYSDYEIRGMEELIDVVAWQGGVAELYGGEGEETFPSEYIFQYSGTGGIGYSVYYYASAMKANPGVKFLAVDGVPPNEASIADGSYPLLSGYFAVTRAGKDRPESAQRLLAWIAGPEGEATLRSAGYQPWPRP